MVQMPITEMELIEPKPSTPGKDVEDPERTGCLASIEKSMCMLSDTEGARPRWAEEREDSGGSTCVSLKVEGVVLSRAQPSKDADKLARDSALSGIKEPM